MRRRDRGRGALKAEPNLLPMLDVVLQLIVFFLMLVHFGTRLEGATRAVRLPEAPAALPGGELSLDRLVVAIDAQGRLLFDELPRDESWSEDWWAEQARSRRSGLRAIGLDDQVELPTLVILRADRAAPYGVVREVLASAQRLGFSRFTLVVQSGGE